MRKERHEIYSITCTTHCNSNSSFVTMKMHDKGTPALFYPHHRATLTI